MLLIAVLTLAAVSHGAPVTHYKLEKDIELRSSVVKTFSIGMGPAGPGFARNVQWIKLTATKGNRDQFSIWMLSNGYPAQDLQTARTRTLRYIVQEGEGQPRQYRNPVTAEAVLPSSGAWQHLFPRAVDERSPERVRYLGHTYVRDSVSEAAVEGPVRTHVVALRPDLLVGPASNTRQKTKPDAMTVLTTNWSVSQGTITAR
jgi:hypothetical protein